MPPMFRAASMRAAPAPKAAPRRRRAIALLLLSAGLAWSAGAWADLARIRESGRLKVAVYKAFAPFSEVVDGKPTGVDVAIAEALSRQLNLSLTLLPFDADENMADDLRNMVWRGHYLGYGPADVMLHVPVDRAFMRENDKATIFAPYYREQFVLVHDTARLPRIRDLGDLAGLPLGAEAGSAGANALLAGAGGALRDKVRIYSSPRDSLRALFAGEIAAAMVTRSQYESALKDEGRAASQYAAAEVSSPLLPPRGWAVGMAVKADNKELADAVQRALDALRGSGELQQIFTAAGLTPVAP